jgi:two-component system LytT family sensor kinase
MAFSESLFPNRALHSTRPRRHETLEVRSTGEESPGDTTPEIPNPWALIWGVGGACWLIVTCTALLWMLPASGTETGGVYVVSTAARAAQHLMVFLAAAVGYRAALALGWPRGRAARARVVLVNCLMALAVVSVAPGALVLAAGFIDGHLPQTRASLEAWSQYPSWAYWTMPLRFFLPPYILGLCAIALAVVMRRQHRAALRAAELARACGVARMAMLSAQLQPHFLFNSLHAISVLVDESPRQASAMLARLGDFLRHALESSHRPWVDVATELAGLEAYLAVQQMRFSDGLRIAIDASPESLGACVPALLLQPLAENAIEHGRDDSGAILYLRVATFVIAERLCIVVNNSSPQLSADLPPQRYGHGLANVELRLRAAYGDDATLTVGPDPQGGTSAFLDLPSRDFATVRPQRQSHR